MARFKTDEVLIATRALLGKPADRAREVLASSQKTAAGLAHQFVKNNRPPVANFPLPGAGPFAVKQVGRKCPRCSGTTQRVSIAGYREADYCRSCRVPIPLPTSEEKGSA